MWPELCWLVRNSVADRKENIFTKQDESWRNKKIGADSKPDVVLLEALPKIVI
jgi:hypothetical protein